MFASQAYKAALDALLVEHNLSYVELVPQNPYAEKLRNGILSALRAGDHSPRFDEDYWINSFNHADRVVQLNIVVLAFDQLGARPLLQGEEWSIVGNPWVLENIETKLNKARRDLERRHGQAIQIRSSKLLLEDWGLSDRRLPF